MKGHRMTRMEQPREATWTGDLTAKRRTPRPQVAAATNGGRGHPRLPPAGALPGGAAPKDVGTIPS